VGADPGIATDRAGGPWSGFQGLDGLVCGHDGAGDHAEVEQCRLIEVAARELGPGRGVLDDGDLEPLLGELPEVCLDAEVGRHAGQDDLVDAALAELEGQVVGFGAVDLVRAGDRHVGVLDQGPEGLVPVGAGAIEALGGQGTLPVEHPHGVHHLLEGAAEGPPVVVGVVVVGGDEDGDARCVGRGEELHQVLDGAVGFHAGSHHLPHDAVLGQEVALRVGDHEGGPLLIDLESGLRENVVVGLAHGARSRALCRRGHPRPERTSWSSGEACGILGLTPLQLVTGRVRRSPHLVPSRPVL
jgi:hypothetical protein